METSAWQTVKLMQAVGSFSKQSHPYMIPNYKDLRNPPMIPTKPYGPLEALDFEKLPFCGPSPTCTTQHKLTRHAVHKPVKGLKFRGSHTLPKLTRHHLKSA